MVFIVCQYIIIVIHDEQYDPSLQVIPMFRECHWVTRKALVKSKLDVYQTEIVALLKNGATKTWIARKYGTSRRNLNH